MESMLARGILVFAFLALALGATPAGAQSVHVHVQDFERPQDIRAALGAAGLTWGQTELKTGVTVLAVLGRRSAGTSAFLFDRGYATATWFKVTHEGTRLSLRPLEDGKPLGIHVHMEDFYRGDGVRELAAHLGLRVKGGPRFLLPGDGFEAVLGPNGSGKSTLIFDRGYIPGERLRLTCPGGGTLHVRRTREDMRPLSVHINMEEFFRPGAVREVAATLGLELPADAAGLLPGDRAVVRVVTGKTTLLFDRGYLKGDRARITNLGGGKLRLDRIEPGKPLTLITPFATHLPER